MKKALALILAFVLVIGASVAGTLAYLTADTAEVVNTFTVGDVEIDLTETTGRDYKVIPGTDIDKNPTVTVETGSENCWLFVEVTENNWPDATDENGAKKLNYSIATGDGGWTELPNQAADANPKVYYIQNAKAGESYGVLLSNKVYVSEELTADEMEAMETKKPTLTFKAYAVQAENLTDVTEAWTAAKTAARN